LGNRAFDGRDGLGLLGFLLVLSGIAQWSRPAMLVVGGAVLIAVAVGPLLVRKGKR